MKTKIKLHDQLKFGVFALYEDGSFQKSPEVDPNFIMLIDIQRWRSTITTNSKTTPHKNQYGYNWENFDNEGHWDYCIIDEDLNVHIVLKPSEEDFEQMRLGNYHGILHLRNGNNFYYNKNGEFKHIQSSTKKVK